MADYIRPELLQVIDVLEAWAGNQLQPQDKAFGICYNLARVPELPITDCEELVVEAAKTWPEYSGYPYYPVPHMDLPPKSAYITTGEGEKWSGAYGESRRRLCQHVANWVRENPIRAEQLLALE